MKIKWKIFIGVLVLSTILVSAYLLFFVDGMVAPPGHDKAPPIAAESAPPAYDRAPTAGNGTPPAYDRAPSAGNGSPPAYDRTPSAGNGSPPAYDRAPPAYDRAPPPSYEMRTPDFGGAPPAGDSTTLSYDIEAPAYETASPPAYDRAPPRYERAPRPSYEMRAPDFGGAPPAGDSATLSYDMEAPAYDRATTAGDTATAIVTPSSEPAPSEPTSSYSVDSLLENMEFGSIAFNAPKNINIDDSPQIQLILSLAETVENLKHSITEEGERRGANIRVSDRMEARLTGYMFQITAITPETQAVSKSQETEWKWEVHPKEKGRHELHLTLNAILEINGHSTPRTIETFDTQIEVNVTTRQNMKSFFMSNWQWLWAAILLPVIGWILKRKKAANKE